MRHPRPTLAQRQRRFLIPLIQFGGPGALMIAAYFTSQQLICDLMARFAPRTTCPAIPATLAWVGLALCALGVALSAHRLYRDHIRGEAYLDHI